MKSANLHGLGVSCPETSYPNQLETTVTYTRVLLGTILLLSLAIPLLFHGCQPQDKTASPTRETESPAPPTEEKGTAVTFSGKDGDVIREESGKGTLPEGFPEDVPLPEKGNVRLSEHRVKTETFTLIIDTKESPEDVVRYYEKESARRGWKVTRITDFGPLISIDAVKDAFRLQVQVSRDKESTQVHLTLVPGDTP